MARVPSNRWTPKDVLSLTREMCKTVDQRTILQEQGKYYYNLAISEIVAMLNSATDPSYFKSEAVVIGSDLEAMDSQTVPSIGHITAIDSTAKTITRDNSSFVVGSIVFVAIINATFRKANFLAKIVSVSSSARVATYVKIGSGTEATLDIPSDDFAMVHVVKTFSTLTYDLTTLSKEYDTVVAIIDSNVGLCTPVSLEVFHSIERSDFGHKSYDDNIIWTQSGNTLYFRNGFKVTAGTKIAIYARQPDYPILYDDTEKVDIADKYVPLLAKRIYTYILLQTENDVPKNLSNEMMLDYQAIAAYAGAEMGNRSTKGVDKSK